MLHCFLVSCASARSGKPPYSMIDVVDALVREYGVLAVFAGSTLEGESVAILGGLFAHQGLLPIWTTAMAALAGTFFGDTACFIIGRRFADHRWIWKLRSKPGFKQALQLAEARPRVFVFFNRYAYGVRLLGGIACGLARIDWGLFLLYNALSSIVWATLFVGIGYFFGLGLETLLGQAIHSHQRLIIAVAIGIAVWVFAFWAIRRIPERNNRSRANLGV